MNKNELIEELTKLAKSNNDLGRFGDGCEKAINEAIQLVKNCSIPAVSNRRELLIAFADWYKTTDFNCEGCCGSDCVDEYLKSN